MTRFAILASLLVAAHARAQTPVLTPQSEAGFRRLIRLTERGALGADVVDMNVGIEKEHVRIELVMRDGGTRGLVLSRPSSSPSVSRYFHIEPDEGATQDDVVRVGRALDRALQADPYVAGDFFGVASRGAERPMVDEWRDGGWRGVRAALRDRFMAPASLAYTVAVIVALAIGVAGSALLFWLGAP